MPMFKRVLTGLAVAAVAIACDVYKPICGCTPSFMGARVSGTITDAAGAPVANTPFLAVGLNAGRSFSPPYDAPSYADTTDANGKFTVDVTGMNESSELHVAVYRSGRSVVEVSAGMVPFHLNRFGPDTVKVAVTLPP